MMMIMMTTTTGGGWLWLPRPPGSASGNFYIYISLPFLLSLEYTPTDINHTD